MGFVIYVYTLYTILYIRFQEVLSIYKIGFWCELTIATSYLVNADLCFGQKYTLMYRLGKGGRVEEVTI